MTNHSPREWLLRKVDAPKPLKKAIRGLRRSVGARGAKTTRSKQVLKTLLGKVIYRSGLHKQFLRNVAIVVLFHRIDDSLHGDPLSCSTAQFKQFCAFFKRYFTVIDLSALLEKLAKGEDISRHLIITFDDGYQDNYEVAAPHLKQLGLPACFFVTTNFIESNHVPWWDAGMSENVHWMTWNQVRSLRSQGFEVGSHTMNHVDLGVISGDEAMAEIVRSKERLGAQLGAPVRHFSYPYGRKHQITEENRSIVRKAAYECCLSAYGGAVSPGTDPFYIRRVPISPWYRSPFHFGFEALMPDRTIATTDLAAPVARS